jgi:hypothetical protein
MMKILLLGIGIIGGAGVALAALAVNPALAGWLTGTAVGGLVGVVFFAVMKRV